MKRIYDISELLRRAGSRIEEVLNQLYPGTKLKRVGSSFALGNIDGAPGQSMTISAKPHNAGCYYDHANTTVCGDLLSLVSYRKGLDRRGAIEWLADFVNLPPQQTFESAKSSQVDKDLEKVLFPLHEEVEKFAKARGISQETLKAYKIKSSRAGTEMLVPHYTEDNALGMVQHRPVSKEKKNPWTNENPVFTLFGKHLIDSNRTGGRIIITEGHWDAMSWAEIGIPACSIPSGAENHNWITTDYHWLNQFTTIVLNYDNDEVGRRAANEAMRRLGPDRCKLLFLSRKDANDHLKAKEYDVLRKSLKEVETSPIPELIKATDIEESVFESLKGDPAVAGIRCFLPTLPIFFRPHEWTMWFGYTSHGKSAAVQNQIAYEASLGRYCLVCSFEQTPAKTLGKILLPFTANSAIYNSKHRSEAYRALSEFVRIYNSMKRVNPEQLIRTLTAAHAQLGVDTFVVDNVMTLEVDRQDNTLQAEVADAMRVFVATLPVHLHSVAHPRKQKDNAIAPPNISEVRGASEWVDMPHNVITVFRSMEKHERMADMINGGVDNDELVRYNMSTPDGRLYVRKQRETGDVPIARFWFHKPTCRFMDQYGIPHPWWCEPSSDLEIPTAGHP